MEKWVCSVAGARWCALAALGVAAGALVSCSSAAGGEALGAVHLSSGSGALRVAVVTRPDPPQRGTNTVVMTVTKAADGAPVDGLTLAVVPWMPADDHGTSLAPVITPQGAGGYVVTDVDFFMSGHWVLNTTFSGPVSDDVAPAYDIP